MNMPILKAQWEFFGLSAPAFSWTVAAGLIIYCTWVYLRQWRESKIRQRTLCAVDKRLKSLYSGSYGGQKGISRQFYDAMDKVFNDFPLLQAAWYRASSSMVSKTEKNGEERLWMGEDMVSVFDDAVTTESQLYKNAPSIITGVGLLATFLAILVALLDVKLANNRIQGLDLLIQGLSGKFLSSVVAITCATLLLGAEKQLFSPVRKTASGLCITVRRALPRLTSAQLLLDLKSEIAEETALLKNITTGLSFNLSQGLAQSIGPAVEKMTAQFSDPLMNATKGQMGQVTESLATTALLLQTMNTQF